jgi:hypothetical protein
VLLGVVLLVAPRAASSSADAVLGDFSEFLIWSSIMMLLGGAVGGSLFDLRGLIKHSAAGDFDPRYGVSYILRPLTAAISGLFVFYLLVGGILAFTNLGSQDTPHGWATGPGILPYLAFAILAGYGSKQFMQKLKDLADSLFATNSQ